MSRHANISIFVPHMGCTHRCSFCNQHRITGHAPMPTADTVHKAMARAIDSSFGGKGQVELAFFGGSFTAIAPDKMLELLAAAQPYLQSGVIDGIRISTRPDAVGDETLALLKNYGVTAIELGAQSMDDRVLALNRRGHTALDVESAAQRIRAAGFELGLQMMTGLYGDTAQGAVQTAERLAALCPDTVRIYPTVVLKNTELQKRVQRGEFTCDSLADTVHLCARLLLFFEQRGIRVIRLGLHELAADDIVCGPWHPALRELCQGQIYLEKFMHSLAQRPTGDYTITVGRGERSKAVGQKKINLLRLAEQGYRVRISEQAGIPPYAFYLEGEEAFAAEINRGSGI